MRQTIEFYWMNINLAFNHLKNNELELQNILTLWRKLDFNDYKIRVTTTI